MVAFWWGNRTPQKLGKPNLYKVNDVLHGFAVRINERVEYWAYDPGVLTRAQQKKLGIIGWKKIAVRVKERTRG